MFWNQGGLWNHARQPNWSDTEWQIRNWLYFAWLSGDHIVEQHVHNIDVANWVMRGHPVRAIAVGAWTGGRVADRTDPGRLLGPILLIGAALTLLTLPIVRFTGEATRGSGDASATLLLAMVAVVATVGDLAESAVKRSLGVKDLGNLLPGHCGMMDRVDAMLFTLPVAHLVLLAGRL